MLLNLTLQKIVKKATGADSILSFNLIQKLWDNYGEILWIYLEGGLYPTVIVKHVRWPEQPKRQNRSTSDQSHKRKVRSYQIEMLWYKKWSSLCGQKCRVPACLFQDTINGEVVLVLEDLDSIGYSLRKNKGSISDAKTCLQWLANFHAQFMHTRPDGLWKTGTYWHLATRPDELKRLEDDKLRNAAAKIDQALQLSPYQTIVHGDAKLENLCFTKGSNQVAAVDFQYVGGGCGIKDVAYLINCCFSDEEAERLEKELLDYYFQSLRNALLEKQYSDNIDDLQENWVSLYRIAWVDFHRFLKGWSSGFWPLTCYSEQITREVIGTDYLDLINMAQRAKLKNSFTF